MEIRTAGSQTSRSGPAEWFHGSVRIDPVFVSPAPARAACLQVTFAAGARTHWHTHPLGQLLIVTKGIGRVQAEGGPVREVRPGDVVWFPPGERHWHGAGPDESMTHITVTEAMDGITADWQEPVSDADYGA